MATAQQLIDMSTQLTDVVKSINTIVGQQHLPYDANTANLSNAAFILAGQANAIGQAGLSALAVDVQGAIGQLTAQVSAANLALQQINDVGKVLNIVGVILTGAGSIATALATGNLGGLAGSVGTFANNLKTALAAA
jgi:hypothetical protein